MSEFLKLERRDELLHIRLNRPEKLNALNDAAVIELRAALESFDQDPDLWVAILSGEGTSFCSGADSRQRFERPESEMRRVGGVSGAGAAYIPALFSNLIHHKPVIAAVHGYAFGAGLHLALQCDLAVAAEDAVFQVTPVKLGLNAQGLVEMMRGRGSSTFAMDVALTARRFSADEAARHGLLNQVSRAGQHLSAAEAIAAEILGNPPLAVRAIVRTRRAHLDHILIGARQFEDPTLQYTADHAEALQALKERRIGKFGAN